MALSEPYLRQLEQSLTHQGLTQAEAVRVVSLVRKAIGEPGRAESTSCDTKIEGVLADLIEYLRIDMIHVAEQARVELRSEIARMASRQKSILVYNMLILWGVVGLIVAIVLLDDRHLRPNSSPDLPHQDQALNERMA